MPLRAIRRLGNLFLGEIENNHLRAFPGKAQGDALAETRATSRHHSDCTV